MIHQIEHLGDEQGRLGSLAALLLALILGVLGTTMLLSILGAGAVVSASDRESVFGSGRETVHSAATSPATSTVQITKTVEPTSPQTGGIVTICFAIGGLARQRVDVALAQDVSGSMGEPAEGAEGQTRLESSQMAANAFVQSLPGTDRAAVVPFYDIAYLAQPLTTNKSVISRTIYGLTLGLQTNIGEGISVSHKELITSPRFVSDTIKTIVLLSDGKATEPSGTAKQYAQARASAAASDSIKIFTIGFGADVDEELLQDIADASGGKYFFAPDADVLETIYLTISLELHNLVITDILPSGVEVNCSDWHDGWCVKGPSGVTTLTFPISNSLLISDPAIICFTATVNLDPAYEGPINLPGSEICYQDSEGQTNCEEFENPPVAVGGRKIVGYVFYDENTNGQRDTGEAGVPDVVVRASTGLTASTNVSGSYVLRISSEPAISVTIDTPSGYGSTTPISESIPVETGIYTVSFGITAYRTYLPVVIRNYPPVIIVNGGFEDEWTGWTHGGKLVQAVSSAHWQSGRYSALLGDPTSVDKCEGNVPVGSAWVEQTVVVPAYVINPTLVFSYNIFTQDKNPYLENKYDRFSVWIDNILVFSDARRTGPYGCDLDSEDLNLHWREGEVALDSGQITIRFENKSTSDYGLDTGWYNTWTFVDNVRIEPANGW